MDYISKEEKDQNIHFRIMSLLKKATDIGHVNARRELAGIYAAGAYGVAKDLAAATRLLEKLYIAWENPEFAGYRHLEEIWRSIDKNPELRKSRRKDYY